MVTPDQLINQQLKDFGHGQKLFGANNNRLSPKFSFLYHVFFEINPSAKQTMYSQLQGDLIKEVGLLVKNVELPKFDIETKNLNAYNQNVTVQTGIKYNPVKIEFHDDSANVVRNFWEDYMSFYYGDTYNDIADAEAMRQNRYATPQSANWGYVPREDSNYLRSVKIYSLSMDKYSLYTLVNPIIDGWSHGTHSAGQNEFIGHSLSLRYEYVRYEDGDIGAFADRNVQIDGLTQAHYDVTTSQITSAWAKKGGLTGVPMYRYGDSRLGTVRQQAKNFQASPYSQYGAPLNAPSQSTLGSRLRSSILRAGQSVVNTAILKAESRLQNIKIIKKIPGLQNLVSRGAAGLNNAIFPSPTKTTTPEVVRAATDTRPANNQDETR
jgi:hypothetical protein